MCDGQGGKNTGVTQIKVTPEMLTSFCSVLSEFEVEGVAIPERLLSRLLLVLAPHLPTRTPDEIVPFLISGTDDTCDHDL